MRTLDRIKELIEDERVIFTVKAKPRLNVKAFCPK